MISESSQCLSRGAGLVSQWGDEFWLSGDWVSYLKDGPSESRYLNPLLSSHGALARSPADASAKLLATEP